MKSHIQFPDQIMKRVMTLLDESGLDGLLLNTWQSFLKELIQNCLVIYGWHYESITNSFPGTGNVQKRVASHTLSVIYQEYKHHEARFPCCFHPRKL